MPTPKPPDQRQWVDFTRNREVPLSWTLSVALHLIVLALLLFGVLRVLFDGPKPATLDLTPVVLAEPGAGNQAQDTTLRRGTPTATDVTGSIDNPLLPPPPKPPVDADVVAPTFQPTLPDDPAGTPIRPDKLTPLPKLGTLLKGLPSGQSTEGKGGPGKYGGPGQGTKGTGPGPDGKPLTQKDKRMQRWTMFFSTNGAADYLRQMKALDVILGVQMEDQTIFLIRDLSKRPAVAEKGAAVAGRIFWMDDHPPSVRAMADELQLPMNPWRVIAFFPEWVEKKLLERELAYGKSFGRNSEDAIKETKFRVEFRAGEPRFTVIEQR